MFIAIAAVIYSLRHGLHTFTAVPRVTHLLWDGKMSISLRLSNNNNNNHDNVYGAIIMTKVIARVRPVHLMNAD